MNRVRPPRAYRRKQRSTSMFFLLWAIFAAFSLSIVFCFGLSQRFLVKQTYKEEAAHYLNQTGEKIKDHLDQETPDWAGGNYNGFLHWLSQTYDVSVVILSENGTLLFPKESHFDPNAPEVENFADYSEKTEILKKKLETSDKDYAIYEGKGEYVYGTKLHLYDNATTYLYVTRSLGLMQTTLSKMTPRIVSMAIFVFVISFAVSSAVSGWLTKPITEMTQKAQQLAKGDFNVDFSGVDYSKETVELAKTLNYARDELSKADKMQKELIANVSHDFKTPLTMIKGYSSMIMEISGDIPEKRNKHAQIIIDEADRLSSLVEDVLDLSKIQAGIETLKMNIVDMSSYVHEILGRFDYVKDVHGYSFIVDIEEELYTQADELKIGQVLYNLVGNAVNYTGEDKQVFVALKRISADIFRFSVRDTGKGIKREEINEIWNRYYRSSESHKRPVKGMGLGLSIVKTILERHGFIFGVQSEEGKGSIFYVDFPLFNEDSVNA